MRNLKAHNTQDAEINITPMLDIVFIMLIFFIVTTSFSKQTGLHISHNPETSSERKKPDVISITINHENDININGQSTKLANIPSILAHLKTSNPEIGAQILAANEVTTGILVTTIDELNTGGIKLLSVNNF